MTLIPGFVLLIQMPMACRLRDFYPLLTRVLPMSLHFGSLLPVDCQQLDRFYVISLSVADGGWWKGSLIPGCLCVTLD